MNSLEQKFNRHTKYFEILENGVLIKDKTAKQNQEYTVTFNNITEEEFIINRTKDIVIVTLILSLLFNAIFLNIVIQETYEIPLKFGFLVFFVLLIPFLSLVIFFGNEFKKDNFKILKASQPINFFYSKKEMNAVDVFIKKIMEAKKDYFVKEYFKVDNLLPVDVQKGRIQWLYENKYVSEKDAKFILEELETKRIIGGF